MSHRRVNLEHDSRRQALQHAATLLTESLKILDNEGSLKAALHTSLAIRTLELEIARSLKTPD